MASQYSGKEKPLNIPKQLNDSPKIDHDVLTPEAEREISFCLDEEFSFELSQGHNISVRSPSDISNIIMDLAMDQMISNLDLSIYERQDQTN